MPPRQARIGHAPDAVLVGRGALEVRVRGQRRAALAHELQGPLPVVVGKLRIRRRAPHLGQQFGGVLGEGADGVVPGAARASGERTQAALEDSAMALVAHVDFQTQLAEEDLPLYPLGRTRASYRGWVVHESARRTLLLTFFMLQAYRVMSGQPVAACDGRLGLCHSFTLSARLWAAPGPVEFALAWRERHHLVVELGDFDAMFADARPEDLDVFGKILLTSMIGVDEAEGWLVSKGGTLGSFVP